MAVLSKADFFLKDLKNIHLKKELHFNFESLPHSCFILVYLWNQMRLILWISSVTKCVYFIGLYLNLIRPIQPSDLRVNWSKAHLPYIHLLTHSQRMCGPPVSSWAGQAKSCETVNDNMNYCKLHNTYMQSRLFIWYFLAIELHAFIVSV